MELIAWNRLGKMSVKKNLKALALLIRVDSYELIVFCLVFDLNVRLTRMRAAVELGRLWLFVRIRTSETHSKRAHILPSFKWVSYSQFFFYLIDCFFFILGFQMWQWPSCRPTILKQTSLHCWTKPTQFCVTAQQSPRYVNFFSE